jgi:phosphoglycolate phosphatase
MSFDAAHGPRRFDLIAFDWDGTLFDSTRIIVLSIQGAVGDLGYTPPSDEAAAHVIGLNLIQALAHAAPEVPKARWPELADRYRHHYGKHIHDVTLFPGTEIMLQILKSRDHRLAVATGKGKAGLAEALAISGTAKLFDATRTAEETRGKPDPLMLHELMAELGTTPERTLMVGDTTHDLNLAANAGCPAVAVNFGAHPEAQLAACNPLYIAHSTADLQNWLLHHA